jgi:hypothetical protein
MLLSINESDFYADVFFQPHACHMAFFNPPLETVATSANWGHHLRQRTIVWQQNTSTSVPIFIGTEKRPFDKTLKTLFLHLVLVIFSEGKSWIKMLCQLDSEIGRLLRLLFLRFSKRIFFRRAIRYNSAVTCNMMLSHQLL